MLAPDLAHALGDDEPLLALRRVLVARIDLAATREDLLAEVERARLPLRAAGRGRDEDLLMDAMDLLAGWCAPHMRI
jgi:hypothetical protein